MGWYLNMEVEGTSIKWWLGLAVAVREIRSGSRLEQPGEAGAGGNLGDSEQKKEQARIWEMCEWIICN